MINSLRVQPVEIRRVSPEESPPHGAINIRWSDGRESRIVNELLRRACPCATCLEASGSAQHSKPLSAPSGGKSALLKVISATLDESLRLEEIWPVGNYALGLRWADGHSSGIYTYEHLLSLVSA